MMERSVLEVVQIMVGTGSFLFFGSVCVGCGLHAGVRRGARWFGPVQATVIKHIRYSYVDGGGA
ncbi:hypothetical protein V5F79_22320 [Xanthobacter flavus]|uniref:hypothetical protein n=1 Tax=Xanthobacter flavus TaxID=281 RepID=UPI0037288C33